MLAMLLHGVHNYMLTPVRQMAVRS